jgi:indole-3-glycerol phosphate synthase
VAILTDEELQRFHSLASEAGLAVLVEVHDDVELDRALAVGAQLIGVNNRDLKTFKVDLATTERLAAKMEDGRWKMAVEGAPSSILHPPSSRLLIAESGIHTRADVERVAQAGAGAILVGESLMRSLDLKTKIAELTMAPSSGR